MQGILSRYGEACEHVAFISNPHHNKHVLLISGLTEGLMSIAYAQPLSLTLDKIGWSLVQVQVQICVSGMHMKVPCMDLVHGSGAFVPWCTNEGLIQS